MECLISRKPLTTSAMQAVRRRLMAAGVVLAGGTVAALPFYHGPTSASPGARPAASDEASPIGVSASGSSALPLQIAGSASSDEPVHSTIVRRLPADAIRPTAANSADPPDGRRMPTPQLSQQHPAAAERVPPATTIRRTEESSLSVEAEQVSESDTKSRTHWIVDGDTLEELARRFLGDRSRWREIRVVNPDVLTTDDVLPIGKEILIPPRRSLNPPQPQPSHDNSVSPEGASGLVPIPWKESPVSTGRGAL